MSAAADEGDAPSIRQRRRARGLALQTLYESDLTGHLAVGVLERLSDQLHTHPATSAYARTLVAGVLANLSSIDASIARYATAWPVEQMPGVDRNLLRIGVFEAVYNSSTIPVAVAINEAVELAKLYGTEASARLVHGVLGSIVAAAPPGAQPASQES
jgi:N utilization substance protein B